MNHSNMYAVGLALSTFANIASEEMSRDLANEVEKLLGSSNTYIRKKVSLGQLRLASVFSEARPADSLALLQAALCAVRIVKRVPDLIENFISKAKSLLQDRNHGVLLSGVTLVIDMCNLDEECRDEFRKVRGSSVCQLLRRVCTDPCSALHRHPSRLFPSSSSTSSHSPLKAILQNMTWRASRTPSSRSRSSASSASSDEVTPRPPRR